MSDKIILAVLFWLGGFLLGTAFGMFVGWEAFQAFLIR